MTALKLGFKVLDVLALMHARDESPDKSAACFIDMDLIGTDRVHVEVGFPGGTTSLFLHASDLLASAPEFFAKWIEPGMLPCLCGARQGDGMLPCGH